MIRLIGPVAVLLLLAGCGRESEHKEVKAEAAPVAVKTALAEPAGWPSEYVATGSVKARTTVLISSKVMGYVREVNAQAGDRVRAGQLLVLLDARDLEAGHRQAEAAREEARSAINEVSNAIAAAKAQLELTQVTFNRMKDLFDKRSISNQEFDEASAKLKVAQANYEMAVSRRSQLTEKIRQAEEAVKSAGIMRDYSRIEAPFAGVVTEKKVEPGNLAAPGQPLLVIEQAGLYRFEAAVDESRLASVRAGSAATVRLDAQPNPIPGRVSEVVPSVDAASRAFTVKIDLPAASWLRSGLFGRASFPLARRQVLVVPAEALSQQGQLQSVFVVEGGAARNRLVTAGERQGASVEILSGLNAGDRVVIDLPAGLADGARVEVKP